jgi:hypothetical protein
LKGEHHQFGWYKKPLPKGWVTVISPNGWTDSYLALEWPRRNFEPFTRPDILNDWSLLVLDGHESHITWEFIAYALSCKIICLCLPPHSFHNTQPLDVGVFSPYEGAYSQALANIQQQGITGVDKILFLEIFQTARAIAFTERNIRRAFRGAGLFPLNPTKVLDRIPKSAHSTGFSTQAELMHGSVTVGQYQVKALPECPCTPRSTERIKQQLNDILDDLDTIEIETGSTNNIVSISPIRKGVQQLASSAITAIAGHAIQVQNNAQLRASMKNRQPNKAVKDIDAWRLYPVDQSVGFG